MRLAGFSFAASPLNSHGGSAAKKFPQAQDSRRLHRLSAMKHQATLRKESLKNQKSELVTWTWSSSLKTRNRLVQLLKRSLFQENELDVLAGSESWLNSSVKNAKVEMKFPDWIDRRKLVFSVHVCKYTRASLKTKVSKDRTSDLSGFQQLRLQVQHME